jgi:segregation and condensation protein A
MTTVIEPVEAGRRRPAFEVSLDNFEGPFDLLLSLISKHKLDITEVSLSHGHRRVHRPRQGRRDRLGPGADDVVPPRRGHPARPQGGPAAAQGDVEDEEDLALLEARDLLFARLLQYKAFKQVAGVLETRLAGSPGATRGPWGWRSASRPCCPRCSSGIGLDQFAALAAKALEPKAVPEVSLQHTTPPAVSVREQAALMVERLQRSGTMTFRALCGDSPDTLTTVARFLALLELFREGAVGFDQVTPLGELTVRWTGAERRRRVPRSTSSRARPNRLPSPTTYPRSSDA